MISTNRHYKPRSVFIPLTLVILLCTAFAWTESSKAAASSEALPAQDAFKIEFKVLQQTGWTNAGLTNNEIVCAHSRRGPDGSWNVAVEFTPIGYSKFRFLTASMIGYQFGVFLNGAPSYGATQSHGFQIRQPCPLAIPGRFTESQAKELAAKLNNRKTRIQRTDKDLKHIKPSTTLSQERLSFGQKQLEMLLTDRPEMKPFVKTGDSLWNWTVNQFAGEGSKNGIRWAGDFPANSPSTVDSAITISEQGPNTLRLRKSSRFGVPADGEMLWSRTVYELFNARGANANFHTLNEKAKNGLITREEYIRQIALFEYETWRQTIDFYKTVWRPHAEEQNLTASDIYWQTDLPATFEEWMSGFTNQNEYPYSCYGPAFDRIVAQRKAPQ